MKMIYNSGRVKTDRSVIHDVILLSQDAEDQVAQSGYDQDPTFYNNLFEYATRSMMEENDEFREVSDGTEVICRSVVKVDEAFTIGMVGIIRVSDAVGELLGLMNGYSYAGGNPVNRVDRNGMCWVNSEATPEQQNQCSDAWVDYANFVTETYTQNWPRDVQILMTQEASYWSDLTYDDFVNQWNDHNRRPPLSNDSDVLASSVSAAGMTSMIWPGLGPEDAVAGAILIGGLCVAALAVVGVGVGTGAITLPLRPSYDFDTLILEYRLRGFDRKVGTLAEHLAKLLEHDVAGYGPSPDPNPYRDPDRGWCTTIKNKITEIRNARYSEAQLSRDLNNAGFGGSRWTEITGAIAEVVARGLCDDHWDDFDGSGPLATA